MKEAEETFGASLAEVAIRAGGSTKLGSTAVLPWSGNNLVLVGCGAEGFDGEALRKAAGAGARAAAALSHGTSLKVAVDMGTGSAEQVRIAAEGALLGCYKVPVVTANPDVPEVSTVTIVSNARGAKPELDKARILADAVYTARDWVDAPANLLYPKTFAASVQSWCKDLKDVNVEVLDEKALVADSGASWPSAAARPVPRVWSASSTPRKVPPPPWPWWARASPSTPAASTSRLLPACTP